MKFTYLGHASFKIECVDTTIFVDPWLNGPTSPIKVKDVAAADIVLVTHDHGDHGYEEAIQICKKTGAYFVAINELGLQAKAEGIENVHTLNIGGSVTIKQITLTLVQAFHSTGKGAPTGFVVKSAEGSFYHSGDTGVFASMKLIGELYKPDVALLPIGSYYTMDIHQAVLATRLLTPRFVIPMHYNTFPVINANPEEFSRLVKKQMPSVSVKILQPGETVSLPET